jgi:hypothetical protein
VIHAIYICISRKSFNSPTIENEKKRKIIFSRAKNGNIIVFDMKYLCEMEIQSSTNESTQVCVILLLKVG